MHRFPLTPEQQATRLARRKKMVAILPTLLTIGNAVCGFACITYAAKVGPEPAADTAMYFQFHIAAWMIFGALVCDGLDGPIARLAKQTSEFGAQLDSLADAISFGVAPAFLMLKFSTEFTPFFPARLLWVVAVLYMLCTVLRLARFNVMHNDADWRGAFCGLPSPAAAATVASLVIIGPELIEWTRPEGEMLLRFISSSLPIITLAVACLMVSRFRYPKLGEMIRGRRSYRQMVKVIFVLVAGIAIHELALPLVLLYFVAASPITAFWNVVILRRPNVDTATRTAAPRN